MHIHNTIALWHAKLIKENEQMKKALLAGLVAIIVSTPLTAATAFTDANDAVKYRQSAFQLIRHNMGDINEMIKGEVAFDAARVQKRADALVLVTTLPWEAFQVAGTEQGGGEAKADIWTNLDDFLERGEKLAADASALQVAARTGDKNELRQAFGNFARNCKACHDKYKQ
jgi:cytochrome c556